MEQGNNGSTVTAIVITEKKNNATRARRSARRVLIWEPDETWEKDCWS